MRKEKFNIEYLLDKVSINNLWPRLSTSFGLSEWFAEDVTESGNQFIFYWESHPSEAELIGSNPLVYVRFRWMEEDPSTYFEFRLHKVEVTGSWILEVTDVAEKDEKDVAITLWNTQIKVLKRKLGLLA